MPSIDLNTTNGQTHAYTNGHTNGHINGHKAHGHSNDHGPENTENFRNPSLQVTEDHKLKFVDAPIHEPGPEEVTLQIKCSGICG